MSKKARIDSDSTKRRDKPAISVLIPIYNVEKYLGECLDSLRSQSFSNFEAICINDGSTDSSPDIAHAFAQKDSRFHVIDKSNSGYGASMNRGLDFARGKYIAILESDDIIYPDALWSLYSAAESFAADAVKGNFTFYWSDPNRADEFHEMISSDMTEMIIDTRIDTRIFTHKASIWSGLYRNDFLKSHSIRFLETPGASYQDSSFAFKVWASASKATFIHAPIIRYRQDNESSSVNSKGKVFCICDEYAEIHRWLRDRQQDPHYCKYFSTLMHEMTLSKYNAYMWNYDRLAAKFRRDFIIRMIDEFRAHESRNEIDWAKWDSWRTLILKYMINNPEYFAKVQCEYGSSAQNYTEKIVFAFKLGGLPLLSKAIWDHVLS